MAVLLTSLLPMLSLASRPPAPAAEIDPKPLGPSVKSGLDWLVRHQLPNGGWGQGEESDQMGAGMEGQIRQANVADTCMAALALLRAGSTPAQGPHRDAILRGVKYVLSEIEASDTESLYVTSSRGTRVQGKLGPYIDTFISAQILSEVKSSMPDEKAETRVLTALDKVLLKIRKHQKDDGTWGGGGWAPVLSQAVAGKAMNRAAQAGVKVPEGVREKAEAYARQQYDGTSGSFGSAGGAGVGLYSGAATVGTLSDSVGTNAPEEAKARQELANAKDEPSQKRARAKVDRYEATKRDHTQAQATLMTRLKDPAFAAGFGTNGGEEFLSYMLVSESLLSAGGKQWQEWDALMQRNLSRVQNKDGSWTGHHCITGRTFVTSAALLVLTADRAPVPLASKVRQG